ncbi:MAG TPA: hypothetical protein VK195_13775, partial [Burkholderiaceae bacterium]|nr:hypothetical protein [Burkholderiaceae bacterium]
MPANAVMAGGLALLVAAGAYLAFRGPSEAGGTEVSPSSGTGTFRQTPAPGAQTQILHTDANLPQTPRPVASADKPPARPFTPAEATASLRAFFAKVMKLEDLPQGEIDELQERLLSAIEDDPEVAQAVAQFYHGMPAGQVMERDMLRSLLVVSSTGRGIVLQEANAIWEGKSEAKFGEMYETYFNLPKQAPPEVVARALADLKAGSRTDERTAVARLNFIGASLEDWRNGDIANLRSEALTLLNQVADSGPSDVVRALAVQKLYRMNSPAEASNIAITQLSKGAYGDLMRETLSSVSSGDVELTP